MGLPFPALPAVVSAAEVGGHAPDAGVEPAGQGRVAAQRRGLARQFGEDRLGHVLRPAGVAARLPQGRRIDQVNVTPHQLGEGRFGGLVGVTSQQFGVGAHASQFYTIMSAPLENRTFSAVFGRGSDRHWAVDLVRDMIRSMNPFLKLPLAVGMTLLVVWISPARGQAISASRISAHLINAYTAGASNIVAGHPRVLKILDVGPGMLQAARAYKSGTPGGKLVLRIYTPKSYALTADPGAS